MNGDPGDCNTPVRRSSRARKPNSRFAEDELDGCIKKIVAGASTSESAGSVSSTPTRQRKSSKKRESECEDIDESTQYNKDAVSAANIVSPTQSSTNDAVNGLTKASDAPTDVGRSKASPEKPKERRTRSNAKNDVLESLPMEEKKRSKKGAKVKKGSAEEKLEDKPNIEETKSDTYLNIENVSPKSEKKVEDQVAFTSDSGELSSQSSKERDKDKHVKKLELSPVVAEKEVAMNKEDSKLLDVSKEEKEQRKIVPSSKESCVKVEEIFDIKAAETDKQILLEPLERESKYLGSSVRDKEESPHKRTFLAPAEIYPRKGNVDFSEAETSTPTRGNAMDIDTQASTKEEKTEEHTQLAENKIPSPVKRRGRSSRTFSKESEEKLLVEPLNIEEIPKTRRKSQSAPSASDVSSMQNIPEVKPQEESCAVEFNPPQDSQALVIKEKLEDERKDCEKYGSQEGSIFVDKIKKSDQSSKMETEECGQTDEGLSRLRKKREFSDTDPEGDLKQKCQDDPNEEQVKRKRKRSDDDNLSSLEKKKTHSETNQFVEDMPSLEIGADAEKKHIKCAESNLGIPFKEEKFSSPVVPKVKEKKSDENKGGPDKSVSDEEPIIQEKRQSSVGSILSFLKRPDITKKIESTSNVKNFKADVRSNESKKKEDNKWKRDTYDSSFTDSKKVVESGWKAAVEKLEIKDDDEPSSRDLHTVSHDVKINPEKEKSSSSDEFIDKSKTFEDISSKVSWDSMKDTTTLAPITFGIKKRKVSKNTTDSLSKPIEPLAKSTDEEKVVEERRNSSIGNILSFLKRGTQSAGGPPNQEDDTKTKEKSNIHSETTEDKIFNFVESSRKSSSFLADQSYSSYNEKESNPPQSKILPRKRDRRVSRWSDREEKVEVAGNPWDNVQSYKNTNTVVSSHNTSGQSNWAESQSTGVPSYSAQNTGLPSYSKWKEILPMHQPESGNGAHASDKNVIDKPFTSWNEQNPSWKNWTHTQNQGNFESSSKMCVTDSLEEKFRESDKETKDSASEDENLDFGNREGMSEFIESYADELDQSGEDVVPSTDQPHMYQREIQPASENLESTWTSKDERSLSPNREMFILQREKELNSPPRERSWSPRSSEIVLSPKSRELMSSLLNMEVKLTPQMEELMSQNRPDSVQSQDTHPYSGSRDVLSIPLPSDSDLHTGAKERSSDIAYIKSDFPPKCPETNQQTIGAVRSASPQEGNRNISHENTWRNPPSRHERPFVERYDIKSEPIKDVEPIKDENDSGDRFEVRKNRIEEILDDKENLEPKVEEKEFSEDEKVEYQRKIQRDIEAKEERNRIVVEQRMKVFNHIRENLYISDRKKSKRSKEVRRMVCDCSLTKEEIAREEVGCGEDCLNRLLMIECGSRCPLKERCTNKRFQNFEYADVEVFNAGDKGCGIRARKLIPAGTFIMEYVGEVFDAREFKRRRKEYSRNHSAHFYFMALKGDLFIDATRNGNISRFINHSCDPNAQTQKWTVNGELRVGFFAQKMVEAGEEINFDYRLERYGREPQKCFCGTAICRGWLGESPDEKTKEEKEEERRQERDRRKREEKRSYVEDVDLEDEIEKLIAIKLRTRQDVLNLCRLMVRADNANSRVMLLRLVQCSTSACKRLFMDYHGLSLLWSWMADLGYAYEHASIKIEILKTLECLPITNKTQLTDSRVLGVVERWSTQSVEVPVSGSPPPPPPPRPVGISMNTDSDSGKKSSDTSEDSDGEIYTKPVSSTIDSSSVDDISMDSVDVEQDALKSKPSLEGCLAEEDSSDSNLSDEKKSAVEPGEGDAAAAATPQDETVSQELLLFHKNMVILATRLLEQWKDLKEYFRIPKKERIELMKEHEREVEEEIRGIDKDRKEKDKYRRDFDRRRRSPDREKEKDRYSRRSSRSDRESREERLSDSPKMSKEQRRQLFEIQVQQEEEAKQRKMQVEMWAMHVDRCRLLGQDPYLTPIFDPTCQFYWDPNTASWHPYNGTEPNLPVPAAYGYRPGENGEGSPMIVGMPPGHVIASQTLTGRLATDNEAATPNIDDPRIDPATIPLPGEVRQTSPTQPLPCQAVPVEGTPPQGARVITFPVPAETGVTLSPAATMPVNLGASALAVPFVVGEEPPPPPPGPITIQLPPRWKMARDSEGHVYFYHVKSRTSQWEPPTLEQHQKLEAEMGSDSDSNDSSSSDSDSTSTTDSEDFSSEEEEEEEEVKVTTVEIGELCDEKMIRRHRAKKPRSEALVQERVISPVLEMDKEAARRERREAKERAQKEVRQERQEDRLNDTIADVLDPNEEIEPLSDKMQRMERSEATIEKERHDYREKAKIRDKIKSKERAATAIADNSDIARKSKENFRAKMATYIVSVLNPYRKEDCRIGRITCNEDFKYLARKLTHFVMIKELKQLHSVEDLECNDSVKYKTKDFVRKYMSKYGYEFKRDPTDTKEY